MLHTLLNTNKIPKTILVISLILLINCDKKITVDKDFSDAEAITKTSKTNFVISLNQNIDVTKNQFYCSSLGYAWDNVKKRYNNELQIDAIFKELNLLNSDENYKNSVSDSILNTLVKIEGNKTTVKAKFKLNLPFKYQDYYRFDLHEFLTDDFIETLSFEDRNSLLEKHHTTFNGETVVTFGPHIERTESDALESVDLLHYKNENEFAIRMKPANEDHEILLYQPETVNFTTLNQAIDFFKIKEKELSVKRNTYDSIIQHTNEEINEALKRNNFPRREISKLFLNQDDHFSMPVLSMNFKKSFKAIEGTTFNGTEKIEECKQLINLEFNEKGAQIESEASVITVSVGLNPYAKNIHFNKPFLIIFKRKDTDNPYLVGWIANTSIMETRDDLTTTLLEINTND